MSRRSAQPKILGHTHFNAAAHEPGPKTVMGHKFVDSGADQAPEILNWLSIHPTTANFLARKIVRHFVSRKSLPKLTSALEQSFLDTDGDLSALAQTLITSDLSWSENEWAYKSPQEFVISVGRAVPESTVWQDKKISGDLGQAQFLAPSPEGWPATGETLITAENILRRLSWLRGVISSAPNWMNEFYLVEEALGGNISQNPHDAALTSLERTDILRLVMMSPEFLMR